MQLKFIAAFLQVVHNNSEIHSVAFVKGRQDNYLHQKNSFWPLHFNARVVSHATQQRCTLDIWCLNQGGSRTT